MKTLRHFLAVFILCIIMIPTAHADVIPLPPMNQAFNVAEGATYSVSSTDTTDTYFQQVQTKAYPEPPGGLLGTSPTWNGFLRQLNRTVVVKLAQPTVLTGASIQFMEQTSRGILFPTHVQFSVSMNGTRWYNAGNATSHVPPYYSGSLEQTFRTTIHRVIAQYFRLQFPVDVWVLTRNLKVFGSPLLSPSYTQLTAMPSKPFDVGTLSPAAPASAGIKNALLVYSGAFGTEGTWTQKQFSPMVAYLSGSGQVSGKMFDTFLFLPYGSSLTTIGGWQHYMNGLFAPNEQLNALNTTVASYQSSFANLGIQEPTVNVILAIPYPNSSITNFGKLWSTQSLSFNSKGQGTYAAYENRLSAMEWYVSNLLAKWKAANYTHLHLVGLYWDAESVSYSAPNEVKLIEHASDLAHKNNLKLFWIPTYNAAGLVSWSTYGFDDVILQSNYFETHSLSIQRMETASQEAFQYGLGIELEMGPSVLTEQAARDRYYNEMVAAYNNSAEKNTVHAVYAGSQLLVRAALSTDPNVRSIYVNTYDFLIGQFTNSKYLP